MPLEWDMSVPRRVPKIYFLLLTMVPKFCLGAIAKDEFPTGHRLVLPDVETPPVQRRFSGKGYEAITRGVVLGGLVAAIMKNGLPEGLADFCPKIQTSFWSTFFATKTDEDDIDQGVIKSQLFLGGSHSSCKCMVDFEGFPPKNSAWLCWQYNHPVHVGKSAPHCFSQQIYVSTRCKFADVCRIAGLFSDQHRGRSR